MSFKEWQKENESIGNWQNQNNVAVLEPDPDMGIALEIPISDTQSSATQEIAKKFELYDKAQPEKWWTLVTDEDFTGTMREQLGFGKPKVFPLKIGSVIKEVPKGVARFLQRDVAGTFGGTAYDWFGQLIEHGGMAVDWFSKIGAKDKDRIYNPLAESIIATGQNISEHGKAAREAWAYSAMTGWEALDEKLWDTDPISYSAGRISEGVASSGLAVFFAMLAPPTAAPSITAQLPQINKGLLLLSTISAGGGFEHAQRQDENFFWSTVHGLADGGIEYAMETSFLDGIKEGRALTAGLKEMGEEITTGFIQNTRAGILENTRNGMSTYDASKRAMFDSLKQMPWEAAAGFIGGYGMAGTIGLAKKVEVKLNKAEQKQAQRDISAQDSSQATKGYLMQSPEADLQDIEPTKKDVGFLKDFMHKYGVREKEGYEPIDDKDFVDIFKFLQMPEDIRHAHPEFGPIYDIQKSREVQRAALTTHFSKSLQPYFDLKNKKKVNTALVQADQNPKKLFGPKALRAMGLNESETKAFLAVRSSLDNARDVLVNKLLEQSKDNKEDLKKIKKWAGQLKNYVPHKWYGEWAVIAQEAFVEKEKAPTKAQAQREAEAFLKGEPIPEVEKVRKEIKKPKTVFMSSTTFADRFTERDRIKTQYPDADVKVIKRKKIPFSAFQDASPWAVKRMVDLAAEKAEVDEDTREAMKIALSDLYKSKGFGMHFIRRKGVPGFAEDLQRPLAEYFSGFSGFITKMDAIKSFPEALGNIHPNKKPNLYRYSQDYIKYVLGDQFEFQHVKRGLYFWYLYGNIKSASLNLTQNAVLGWPVLSEQTNWSLPRLMTAMSRTAIGALTIEEQKFLDDLEAGGFLDPKLSQEISGYAGNPLFKPTVVGKAVAFADFFREMERFNRRSMAVALYNAGITDLQQASDMVEEAHFHYGKGNRPTLARGYLSPVMTFRSWGINYVQWLKNQIKTKKFGKVERSLGALVLLGGLAGLPGWEIIKRLWKKVFGTEIEVEARSVLGEDVGRTLLRGVPAQLGIDFSGSVGQADIIPTEMKDIPGVVGEIPSRAKRITDDLLAGNHLRALEDSAPEFLRNPLSAYRLYKQGMRTRHGAPVVDLITGENYVSTKQEALLKSLGFQPTRAAEQYRLGQAVRDLVTERQEIKQNWADRYTLAIITDDTEAANDVINEIMAHNSAAVVEGRTDDIIKPKEFEDLLRTRGQAANIPPKHIWPKAKKLIDKWRGK